MRWCLPRDRAYLWEPFLIFSCLQLFRYESIFAVWYLLRCMCYSVCCTYLEDEGPDSVLLSCCGMQGATPMIRLPRDFSGRVLQTWSTVIKGFFGCSICNFCFCPSTSCNDNNCILVSCIDWTRSNSSSYLIVTHTIHLIHFWMTWLLVSKVMSLRIKVLTSQFNAAHEAVTRLPKILLFKGEAT